MAADWRRRSSTRRAKRWQTRSQRSHRAGAGGYLLGRAAPEVVALTEEVLEGR
jgi:hypothetical protein